MSNCQFRLVLENSNGLIMELCVRVHPDRFLHFQCENINKRPVFRYECVSVLISMNEVLILKDFMCEIDNQLHSGICET